MRRFLSNTAAQTLYGWLSRESSWGLTLSDGERILGLAPDEYRSCTAIELRECTSVAYSAAQKGFSFIREELWVSMAHVAETTLRPNPLQRIFALIQSASFAQYAAEVVGARSLKVVRVTIERYTGGHFFGFTTGAPADATVGFSIDLTDTWRAEWGGLLEFCNFVGCIDYGYLPEFNTLTLYDLSKSRAISLVTPLARRDRYAIVGQMNVV